jgi:hypothetical protein
MHNHALAIERFGYFLAEELQKNHQKFISYLKNTKKIKIILHPLYLPTSTSSTSTSIPIQTMFSLSSIDSKKFKQQLNELLSVSSNLSVSYSSKAHAETLKRNNQESLRGKNKWIQIEKLMTLEDKLLKELPSKIEAIQAPFLFDPHSSSSCSIRNKFPETRSDDLTDTNRKKKESENGKQKR